MKDIGVLSVSWLRAWHWDAEITSGLSRDKGALKFVVATRGLIGVRRCWCVCSLGGVNGLASLLGCEWLKTLSI